MKQLFCCAVLLCGALAIAQAPASSPHVIKNNLGFSYAVPVDWEVADAKDAAEARQQAAQSATNEVEKKGLACVDMGFMARHGAPPSIIVEVALPFDCYGQQLTNADLPGFAEGTSQGLKQQFDIGTPTYGTYTLGSHQVWIERVTGTPKNVPNMQYTLEIACTPLKKAAVCWMTMAADDASMKTFEDGMVTLDDDKPVALVPKTAFDKKP